MEVNRVTQAWVDGPVIQIGSVGGNVTLALDRPDYRLHWLTPAAPEAWRPHHLRTPSYLLDARRRTVPFHPRRAVQQRLTDWLDEPDTPLSVLLVHGPGGRGKTRLAGAFAGVAHTQGWSVAQATDQRSPRATTHASSPPKVLITVDNADRWTTDPLLEMITALPADFPDATVRVLLLARSPASWPHLAAHLDRVADLPEPIELGDLTTDRDLAFQVAATAFQQALDLPAAPVPTPDLTNHGSALLLHMAALAAVCATRDHSPTPADLSTYLLNHERRFWPEDTRAADTVFLATLFGPTEDAETLLAQAGLAPDWARHHDRLYPEEPFAPLRPDLLGEDFVASHLATHRRAAKLLTTALGSPTTRRALIVVAAAADRHEHVRPVLWQALADHWESAGAPVIRTVAAHAPFELCVHLLDRLPYAPDLIDPCAGLATRTVELLPDTTPPAQRSTILASAANRLLDVGDSAAALPLAREALELDRRLADIHGEAHLIALARSTTTSSFHLAAAGANDALSTFRESVGLWRRIAETDPEHRAELAVALSVLAHGESGPDQRALALEAVMIALELAAASGGHRAHLMLVVTTLTSVGLAISEAGDHTLAPQFLRQAVELARRLDSPTFLADTLLCHAVIQSTSRDGLDLAMRAAREAHDLYRELADHAPKVFQPRAAAALQLFTAMEQAQGSR